MLASHSFSPISPESISALTPMTATGVFSSWLASEINCFCRRSFSSRGRMIRFDRYRERKNSTTMAAPPMISTLRSRVFRPASDTVLSMKATSVQSGLRLTVQVRFPVLPEEAFPARISPARPVRSSSLYTSFSPLSTASSPPSSEKATA